MCGMILLSLFPNISGEAVEVKNGYVIASRTCPRMDYLSMLGVSKTVDASYFICFRNVYRRHAPGPRLNIKTVLSTYGDFQLKIRRPLGRLFFNMGIAIPGKTVFLIETAPRLLNNFDHGYNYQL